jgi:hypothetical protein
VLAETHDLPPRAPSSRLPSRLGFMFVANQTILICRISTIPLHLSLPAVALQLYHLPLRARRPIRQINLTVAYTSAHTFYLTSSPPAVPLRRPACCIFPWRIADLNTTAIKNTTSTIYNLALLPILSLLPQDLIPNSWSINSSISPENPHSCPL